MPDLEHDIDSILATMARLYVMEGKAKEVAILAYSDPFISQCSYDSWNGGQYGYEVYLHLSMHLYFQTRDHLKSIQEDLLDKSRPITSAYGNHYIEKFIIAPEIKSTADWREKAKAWVAGDGVTNQGRVRSDNVAPLMHDGLLFRSPPEVNLYKVFKARGIPFAPLPVFLKGGKTYQRIEPDFVIIKDGLVMVVEVDGDTVHTETPAEAHGKRTMLIDEGVHVERVQASECDSEEKAQILAEKLEVRLQKLRTSRR